MKIAEKGIRREDWSRIIRRSFACESVCLPSLCGEIALLRMDEVREPLYVSLQDRRYCIVNQGYSWLQIAPRGENWWLTCMFDEKGELLQHYFDITLENRVREGGQSSFLDLFLDVVLLREGIAVLLDEDELEEALSAGVIDAEKAALATRTAHMLVHSLPERHEELRRFCENWRDRLLRTM